MTESRIYFHKSWKRASLTFRRKEVYEKPQLSIWWSLDNGVGIINKPGKTFKHLIIGMTLISIKLFFKLTYIGKRKPKTYTL